MIIDRVRHKTFFFMTKPVCQPKTSSFSSRLLNLKSRNGTINVASSCFLFSFTPVDGKVLWVAEIVCSFFGNTSKMSFMSIYHWKKLFFDWFHWIMTKMRNNQCYWCISMEINVLNGIFFDFGRRKTKNYKNVWSEEYLIFQGWVGLSWKWNNWKIEEKITNFHVKQ